MIILCICLLDIQQQYSKLYTCPLTHSLTHTHTHTHTLIYRYTHTQTHIVSDTIWFSRYAGFVLFQYDEELELSMIYLYFIIVIEGLNE